MSKDNRAVKELAPNEFKVKVDNVEVVFENASNVCKVNGVKKYLKQIVWEETVESAIKEIQEDLKK